MRQLATLKNEADANRLAAHLVTLGITAHAEHEEDGWAVWVRDENHMDAAQEEYEHFLANPGDTRYDGVERAAHSIRREESRRREQMTKNIVEMRGRWRQGISRKAPLVFVLIALSVVVYLLTAFGEEAGRGQPNQFMRLFLFRDPVNLVFRKIKTIEQEDSAVQNDRSQPGSGSAFIAQLDQAKMPLPSPEGTVETDADDSNEMEPNADRDETAIDALPQDSVQNSDAPSENNGSSANETQSGGNDEEAARVDDEDAAPTFPAGTSNVMSDIFRGEVWRLVTPIFLHFGILHLVFNMYMLYYLGAQVEDRRGTLRFALLVLLIAVVSNLAQALIRGPNFGGMSGVDYGLFGYVWMKTMYAPDSGMHISRFTIILLIAWFFMGIAGWPANNIANVAHGAGLLVGVVVGYAPVLLQSLRHK